MAKRPYRQTRRAESSGATRARILESAREQMVSGEGFTLEAVAQRAGVSRVTVYAHFGDGEHLREAVFDHLAESGGLMAIPTAFGLADPRDGVLRLVDIFCGFYASHRAVLRSLNAQAALAAAGGDLPEGRNRRRHHMLGLLVARAAPSPVVAARDRDAVVSLLHAISSFEFFDRLAGTAGEEAPALIHGLAATVLAEL